MSAGPDIALGKAMRNSLSALLFLATISVASTASASPYYYVDWLQADVSGGTASGTITLPDASVVTVGFQAITGAGGQGNLASPTQTGCGTNYWNPAAPYMSAQVDNAPPSCDIISLQGGVNQTYFVTLSEAIKDPIMAIVSLGRGGSDTTYDFDSPFTIVSQGVGFWGGGPSALEQLPGDILEGNEGHGTIQFIGTFNTFSWVVPTPEYWHGFTFGIRTTERIEPGPAAVPEPASLLLLAGGLATGAARRRYARKASK